MPGPLPTEIPVKSILGKGQVLGFSKTGKQYLNQIKKAMNLPLITTYSKGNSNMLKLEQRITSCYSLPFSLEEQKKLYQAEYQKGPIQK